MDQEERKKVKQTKEKDSVPKKRKVDSSDVEKKHNKIKKVTDENIAKSIDKKKTTTKKKKKKKHSAAIAIVCLIVGIGLGVCGGLYIANNFEIFGEKAVNDTSEEKVEGDLEKKVEDSEDDLIVTTPYCDLHFPQEWTDQIETGQEEGDVHAVSFYGTVEGKERKLLFDILFGEEVGMEIGTLAVDGQNVRVAIQFADIIFDETWTEEEKNTIYSMQEDMNYLIDELKSMENFTPAE